MAAPVNITSAAAAYARTAAQSGAQGLDSRDKPDDGEFADLIKTAIQSAIDTNKRAEHVSKEALADRADLEDVITAVAEAEVSLQAVVAVRDKVIEAYKEIIRMTT